MITMTTLRACCLGLFVGAMCLPGQADDVLHRFEGDVPQYDPSVGWSVGNACINDCSEAIEEGRFGLRWAAQEFVNFHFRYGNPPNPSPPLDLVDRMAVSFQPPDRTVLLHVRR